MESNKGVVAYLFRLIKLACLTLLIFSIAPIFEKFLWHLGLLTHFRLQYFIISIVFFLLFISIRNKTFIAVSLLSSIINLAFVLPIYIAGNTIENQSSHSTLTLLHSNVLYSNSQYAKLIDQIATEDPDIIVLQEVTDLWLRNISPIKKKYKHFIEIPRPGSSGMALFSKIPISDQKIQIWGVLDLPSIEAKFVHNDSAFHVIATHPPPPISKQLYEARNSQIKSIANYLTLLKAPKILIGDLNISTWSPHYRILEAKTGLANASKGFGIVPTWRPARLNPMMIPIDHCLVSNHFTVLGIKSGHDIGSDHLPIIVKLRL